jgi:zinc protease
MSFDRTQKPIPKSVLEFVAPTIEEIKFKNGLRVFYIFKDKLPLIRLNLMIGAGSKFDPNDKKGLAYLTSLVLDEGAGELNALEISDEFDFLGSNFSVSADNDSINLSLQCLSDNFERSIELFSKVLLKPSFNQTDFDREKKKLMTQIKQSKDEPEYLADQIFDKVIFGESNNYSFPVIGYYDSVESISRDDVFNYYQKYFAATNSFLIIVGNTPKYQLISVIEKYLADWENLAENTELSFNTSVQKKKIYIYNKTESVQTEIRVGHAISKRNNNDYFQKYLLNAILGGQFASRINLNLREKNGYTYGASSRYQYFKDAGLFQVATSVGTENTVEALKEIIFELENIKNGVTDQELNFAKSSITKKFPMNFETYPQIVSNISGKILFDLPSDYFETYINKVNNVTKNEVDEIAKATINNDQLAVVLVGDLNLLKDKIYQLGFEISEVDINGKIID